ncbi:C6 transcription factor [Pochonia chlamydosporia 170]|uniref:C6 transcription factor n=1 Tax=Pochonia chlamydosporia 170 TaxID=1380566 RepID=A0A179F962_METCM|nr:C6 transcription factor [Pochonia chlamydosporia 170]OAQ61982.1 C6 transcription factor [Pochonia chlamydosporia 170]
MAKGKRHGTKASRPRASSPAPSTIPQTTSAIRTDSNLGYKVRVLIHDLRNVEKNPSSARRLNATICEQYISSPYFTAQEAEVVKSATVDVEVGPQITSVATEAIIGKSLDEAICNVLKDFLEKRRASGDARPCGPHHLAPLYAELFGIRMEEVEDEKFLGRLRRQGV